MARLYKDVAIETLRHRNIRRINFQYGRLRVYPSGYQQVVEKIEAGRIQFRMSGDQNAHYPISTARGAVHFWEVPPNQVHRDSSGELRLNNPDLAITEKATVVHEATHALHDIDHLGRVDRYVAEGAAYVAAGFAALLWGLPPVEDGNRLMGSHAYARWIASNLLSGKYVYLVPRSDVTTLGGMVLVSNMPNGYVFNGI